MADITLYDINTTGTSRTNYTALEGQIINNSYNPGLIVLAYMISYVGAWTTLELLHKRTSWRGKYNWYLHTLVTESLLLTKHQGLAPWISNIHGWHCNLVHELHLYAGYHTR